MCTCRLPVPQRPAVFPPLAPVLLPLRAERVLFPSVAFGMLRLLHAEHVLLPSSVWLLPLGLPDKSGNSSAFRVHGDLSFLLVLAEREFPSSTV